MFTNRHSAGRYLSRELKKIPLSDCIICAIPRGGVVVAEPISKIFHTPIHIVNVKKVTFPSHPEYSVGAVTTDMAWTNTPLVRKYSQNKNDVQIYIQHAQEEVHRRARIYGLHNGETLPQKTVILVDDGVATGETVWAAYHYLKSHNAQKIILATPVISQDIYAKLKENFYSIVTLLNVKKMSSVSSYYKEFAEVTDTDVINILGERRLFI